VQIKHLDHRKTNHENVGINMIEFYSYVFYFDYQFSMHTNNWQPKVYMYCQRITSLFRGFIPPKNLLSGDWGGWLQFHKHLTFFNGFHHYSHYIDYFSINCVPQLQGKGRVVSDPPVQIKHLDHRKKIKKMLVLTW
jgi:hypothetical protein